VKARLFTPVNALALGALTLVVLGVGVLVGSIGHESTLVTSSGPLPLAFGLVGLLVAYKRPANPIGWCFLVAAFLLTLDGAASAYSVAVYRGHHDLPLGALALFLQPSWAPAIVLFGASVQLFPSGRLPPAPWSWLFWGFLALGFLWIGGALAIVTVELIQHSVHVTSGGDLIQLDHPTGDTAWWGWIEGAFFAAFGLLLIAWLIRELPAYRRATGERRQQLKWLMAGGVVAAVGLAVSVTGQNGVLGVAGTIAITALPISVGIGVLKFRLYEIDRLISRTLSYAIVTGSLVVVFLGVVVLTTDVLPFSSPVGVAASTLAAAALFNPLRQRVQRFVDRRFNRARYDAEAIVGGLTRRLREAVDLDTVQSSLDEAVRGAVQPVHISVWLNPGATDS
jgi:hypothetical protein